MQLLLPVVILLALMALTVGLVFVWDAARRVRQRLEQTWSMVDDAVTHRADLLERLVALAETAVADDPAERARLDELRNGIVAPTPCASPDAAAVEAVRIADLTAEAVVAGVAGVTGAHPERVDGAYLHDLEARIERCDAELAESRDAFNATVDAARIAGRRMSTRIALRCARVRVPPPLPDPEPVGATLLGGMVAASGAPGTSAEAGPWAPPASPMFGLAVPDDPRELLEGTDGYGPTDDDGL